MYYVVEQMDGYFRIGGPDNVFCYLIVGEEKAALIDTGYGFANLKEEIRKITSKPLLILNTHGHVDHTSGNAQFEEKCYIGERDVQLCNMHTSEKMRLDSIIRAKQSMNFVTGEVYNALPEGFDAQEYCKRGAGNLVVAREGDTFDLGGASLKVYEAPGHTQGGLSFLYEQKNLLFIGDATGMFVWLFAEETTDLATYIHTVKKMYGLNCDGYVGSHNPIILKPEDLLRCIRAAEEADYDSGEPFQAFLGMETEPRICALDNMTLANLLDPGFASVVIGKNKRRDRNKEMST